MERKFFSETPTAASIEAAVAAVAVAAAALKQCFAESLC